MSIIRAITIAVINTMGMTYFIIFVIVVSAMPILIKRYDPTGGVTAPTTLAIQNITPNYS